MASHSLGKLESEIRKRQLQIADLGPMRPGTLSVQYRDPGEQKTPFNQISYTHLGRSRSEYVRPENLLAVRREIAAYKRFKALCSQILDLSIQASRLRCGTRPTRKTTDTPPSKPSACT
jgi:hypothetical protein